MSVETHEPTQAPQRRHPFKTGLYAVLGITVGISALLGAYGTYQWAKSNNTVRSTLSTVREHVASQFKSEPGAVVAEAPAAASADGSVQTQRFVRVNPETGTNEEVVVTVRKVNPNEKFDTLAKSMDESLKKITAGMDAALKATNEKLAALTDELKKQQAASQPLPSKFTTPPPIDTPAAAPSAAPERPAQVASAQPKRTGDIDLVIPKGFHVVTMGDADNIRKARSCTGRLVVDTASPKCYVKGGTRFCPNRCEH